jgi:fatty-acyl-CoA synthase
MAETTTIGAPSLAERRARLAARMSEWRPSTLDRALADRALEVADRPLVLAETGTATYRDTVERAERIARGLRALGLSPGDRVALIMANHPEFVPIAYAVWRLGCTLIPVNFAFRASELAYVLGQSECRMVITMGAFRGLDYLEMLDAEAPGWAHGQAPALPALRQVVLFGAARSGVPDLADVERLGAADPAALGESPAGPFDPAVIMYTSGTTGAPKGVVQSHDNLLRSSYSIAYHRAYEEGRRILFALPLYHAFGLVVGVLACQWAGGAIIPQTQFDPAATFAAIERHRATDALFVPTMSIALIDHPAARDHDLSSLFSVLIGAAPTPVRTWQQVIATLGLDEVCTGYGMTELSSATVLTRPGDALDLVERTVGCVVEGGAAGIPDLGGRVAEYRTADPLTGELLPDGAEGELVCRSPMATSGYFGKPELNAALFLPGGWLRSGDLGRIRPDGFIELTGRSKELYKSGGELVAPREIEEVLAAHPAVEQAYVVGLPDDTWGEIGAAWVVPAAGADPSADELVEWCRARLAKFKRPRHVLFTSPEGLPRTPTGKVKKHELIVLAKEALERSDG